MISLEGVKDKGGKWQQVDWTQAVCGLVHIYVYVYTRVHAHTLDWKGI